MRRPNKWDFRERWELQGTTARWEDQISKTVRGPLRFSSSSFSFATVIVIILRPHLSLISPSLASCFLLLACFCHRSTQSPSATPPWRKSTCESLSRPPPLPPSSRPEACHVKKRGSRRTFTLPSLHGGGSRGHESRVTIHDPTSTRHDPSVSR